VAHLATILTLDLSVVARLGTVLREVSDLIAVAALGVRWVLRFSALLGYVTLLIAVAASNDTLLFAFRSPMALR
jgi:hypothetical protein